MLLALGAVCSAAAMGLVCRAIAERAPTSTWLDDPAGVGQSALAVAVPVMLFCGCLKALAWLRRARIEFFEEAIRVCADSTEEVRWDEIVTLRRLFYRNLHDIAHEAGWC